MYPGTIIEFEDRSQISTLPITEVRNKPLFAALFTSDKGTEDWYRVTGKDFFKMYGNTISFDKHGQPLLQAAVSINAGAELLCKRLVAPDSTLANIGIVASIEDVEVQATDADGNLLYLDAEGKETIEVTESPVMTTKKTVSYSIKTAENVTTVEAAEAAIKNNLADGEYLLYTIADIGRGVSKKRIKIVPNYTLSRHLSYVWYTISVLEGAETIESMTFSINNELIVNDMNVSLQSMIKNNSTQLTCLENASGIDDFVAAIAEATGLEEDEVWGYDPLFGKTNKGVDIENITVDTANGIDLQYSFGQMLQSGSNGSFGTHPFEQQDVFAEAAIEALDGTYDTVIFNLDQYKITAFVDANYPKPVKRAIETLAVFREDFMYFRDQGLGKTDVTLITDGTYEETKTMFAATYPQSYDVIDPYTKKQITVTIGYSLAKLLVNHCDNGCILPTAGMKHKMVIDDCVYGTLSFTPTVCPDPIGNQKTQLEELRVNYASYIDNQLVIETLYTSQEKYTQWSFVNNVMGIQDVVRAIRRRCPAIRYTFIEGEDLEKYKAEVEEVIAPFRSNFLKLEFEYTQDATYAANKIFYAVLNVGYKDFIQTEWFKIIALDTTKIVTG